MLAVDKSLTMLKQKSDMAKIDNELNKAVSDYLEHLGMKPHLTVFDELGVEND